MSAGHDGLADAVKAAIEQVLRESARSPRAMEPGSRLAADLGLDSLDLAQTIVLLERSLGVDPFRTPSAGAGLPAMRTVADLIAVYGRVLPGARDRGPPVP